MKCENEGNYIKDEYKEKNLVRCEKCGIEYYYAYASGGWVHGWDSNKLGKDRKCQSQEKSQS